MTSLFMSDAYNLTFQPWWFFKNSLQVIAKEYGSSPVEHAAVHMRSSLFPFADFFSIIAGNAFSKRKLNCFVCLKK